MNSNNRNKKFSCSINSCNYKTDQKGNLDRHMKTQHIRDPKDLLQCTEDGCTYKTFASDNLDKHIRSYAHWYSQDRAIVWEKLCYEVSTVILNNKRWRWKKVNITTKIQDRKYIIPEKTIYNKQEIDIIIDAKFSSYSIKEKDYIIYPQIAKKVIFWILNGESQIKRYNSFFLEFVSADDLKKNLLSYITDINSSLYINSLLERIDQCKNARTNNSSVNEIKNKNSHLDSFM